MKRYSDVWILIGLFVALLVGSFYFAAPEPSTESKAPTSYNSDPAGNKAFYTLLGRLGYTTGRLRKPYTQLPNSARMLIVIEPGKRKDTGRDISEEEQYALRRWVRGGGIVLVLSNKLTGLPYTLTHSRQMGRGQIYSFESAGIITNKAMRNPKDALQVLSLITQRASKNDPILFDEYHHGLGEADTAGVSISRQVIVCIYVLAVAGLVLAYSRARRFGAVRGLPADDSIRPGFEYVKSVGRLYRRAHATDLAAEILCDSFRRGLCLKLALPADAAGDVVIGRMQEDIEPDTCKKTRDLLLRCDRFKAGERPSDSELLDIALDIRNLEKELRIGPVDG